MSCGDVANDEPNVIKENEGVAISTPSPSPTIIPTPPSTIPSKEKDDQLEEGNTEQSIARIWNEILLNAIRNDYARPTVHARNLFHLSAAMYDAWANYSSISSTYFLGKTLSGYSCSFGETAPVANVDEARQKAISYAAYRIISHRFSRSPNAYLTQNTADNLMTTLGYDQNYTSTNYKASDNPAAALGNHIAQCYIGFGLQDGSNEANNYANRVYNPVNSTINPEFPGNPNILDLNRWQAISLTLFIDQAGFPITSEPHFLGAEWGAVKAFSLKGEDKTTFQRDNFDYQVYFDPGMPPTIEGALSDEYKWNFSLVSMWSSHLDPNDGVMIDISPSNIGNLDSDSFPRSFSEYDSFYNTLLGGDAGTGHTVNPITSKPYSEQIVPRGDYARVLAEFWADGPDSETPPGHWFVILNTVSEHPLFEKKFSGQGEVLDPLEWDVKAYFTLAGAMHDSAIAAWGIKGWYDYIRPVSSIRAMADLGQSSDTSLASYHVNGIKLVENHIEIVSAEDPLAGEADIHVGKIKLRAWQGPDHISSSIDGIAGVGWILAENWWPYQRPTFVTPPFAGYVSGHSTFSRAAAEVLTRLTGDPFFPGGMSGFNVKANEFLVFEQGPSMDMTLEWATYRDASDQCSLSRIWGGIHPPVDDIPGRLIGEKIGIQAFTKATSYFIR